MNLADAITETLKTNTQDEFPSELTEGDLILTKVRRAVLADLTVAHTVVYMVVEVTPPRWVLPTLTKTLERPNPLAPAGILANLKDASHLTCKLFMLGIKRAVHTALRISTTTNLVVIEVNIDNDKKLCVRGNCTRYPGEKGLLITGELLRCHLVDTNLNLTARYGGNALTAYYN